MPRAALPNQAKFRTSLWTALRGIRFGTPSLRAKVDWQPSLPGPFPTEQPDDGLAGRLHADVRRLAVDFPGRNVFRPSVLHACEDFLAGRLADAGLSVTRQFYEARGVRVANIQAQITGTTHANEVILIGAHYDAVELRSGLCPGANDNGSGVAVTLALADLLAAVCKDSPPRRTVRFVLWPNEEPPFFWTKAMGSLVHARGMAADNAARVARGGVPERLVGMITPETIGYVKEREGSQRYPLESLLAKRLPKRGNFVAICGMIEAEAFVHSCAAGFRAHCPIPCLAAALPGIVPHVGASDHWSYWQHGWPAVMVTDTAPYRYKWYHTTQDTPEKLNYEWMASVTRGLAGMVRGLVDA